RRRYHQWAVASCSGRRRGAIRPSPRPVARGGRELPRAEGEPELPRPAGRTHQHRGPYPGGPPLLQRERSGLQPARAGVPLGGRRPDVQLQAEFFEIPGAERAILGQAPRVDFGARGDGSTAEALSPAPPWPEVGPGDSSPPAPPP